MEREIGGGREGGEKGKELVGRVITAITIFMAL